VEQTADCIFLCKKHLKVHVVTRGHYRRRCNGRPGKIPLSEVTLARNALVMEKVRKRRKQGYTYLKTSRDRALVAGQRTKNFLHYP